MYTVLSHKPVNPVTLVDAQDFYFLLKNYHHAGNSARIYDEASTVLESNNYELELTGAALLGYDTNLILEKKRNNAPGPARRAP